MDRTERFYRIDALLRARRTVPVSVFLDELGVSRATFKRDLEYLRDRLHAPIVWDRARGGYRFAEPVPDAPRYALPGLWLNESEIRALIILHELLEHVHPGLIGPHVEPVMKRVRALLDGDGDRDGADAGAGGTAGGGTADAALATAPDAGAEVARRVRILHAPRRAAPPAEFAALCRALMSRRRVRVVHYSRERDETLERTLSPQRIVHYRDNWYLDAWCHLRDGLRSFAVDCIRRATPLDQPAREVDDALLDRTLGAGYGIFAGGRARVARLRFSAFQARWVADEVWHSRQKGAFDARGRYLLEVPYTDARELVMNVLRYGADVEVLGPASLRTQVREALRAASRHYGRDEPSDPDPDLGPDPDPDPGA